MSDRINSNHWPMVRLGDMVRQIKDKVKDPESVGISHYVPGGGIHADSFQITNWQPVNDGLMGPAFHMRFKLGHILYKSRVPHGVAVADKIGICANTTYVLEARPERLLPQLLPFLLITDRFRQFEEDNNRGSTNLFLNYKQIANYEFALPPLEEQRRIAKLLEANELLLESLNEAMLNLRKLRQAFEKQIFLMGNEKQKVFLKELLQNQTITFQTGPFGTVLKASSYTDSGHPVVNPSDMVDGKIVLDKCKFVGDLDWTRLNKYQINTNDMFIGRKGDMQNIVFVEQKYNEYLLGSDCIRFRVHDDSLMPKFLFYYLRADVTRQWLQSQAYGTVMPGINEKLLARMQMVFPDITEQKLAVEKIERMDDSIRQFEKRLKQTKTIKQSILTILQSEFSPIC